MQQLDERALVDRVMVEWWDSAAHALPWAGMPLDDRFGELRKLAAALVSAAITIGPLTVRELPALRPFPIGAAVSPVCVIAR